MADDAGLRVTVLGTPAEERRRQDPAARAGRFDGAHAAMMVHPSPYEQAEMPIIAVNHLKVAYTGKEAHASAYPFLGVNAADALVVAQTAIGLLRQHLRPGDRVHGIVTKGGDAANIIPAHTDRRLDGPGADLEQLEEASGQGGPLLRGRRPGHRGDPGAVRGPRPYSEMRHDHELSALYQRNAEALGRSFWTAATAGPGSTDMGNVSLALPSIHPTIGIDSLPAVNHQPEFTASCATPAADQAVVDGAVDGLDGHRRRRRPGAPRAPPGRRVMSGAAGGSDVSGERRRVAPPARGETMKYMILTYASQQDYDGMAGKPTGEPVWSAEDFAAMGAFMESFNQELDRRARRDPGWPRRSSPGGSSCRTACRW